MLRISLFIWLLVVGVVGLNLRATACSCIGESTVGSAFKQARFVGVGTVKAKTRTAASTIMQEAKYVSTRNSAIDTSFFSDQYRYTVEIEEVYKGSRHRKTIEIFTGAGGGDCGVEFSVGSRYVIYANLQNTRYFDGRRIKTPSFFTTDICTRTTEVNEVELAELRKAVSR